ncbi:threonine synthase [Thermosinus carboxydivorans Nor1]|uniref:Threonine synthase n=1 Tax=Thermosinus carboxydivorans Nor1 TaxID=401526 RepID=A1HS50_9FIRM|nr:threonine synthase [Thermosinus carboxydivorans]EAX47115.1 threonine synthase [Thermosinus carboxydivorans Nor1]
MYLSTRGGQAGLSAAEAIKTGLADDGGLFVPSRIPQVSQETLAQFGTMSYWERAAVILAPYLPDYSDGEIRAALTAAYNTEKFDDPEVAPLRSITADTAVLELWHGPTSAFKDMALQLMPRLLSQALRKTGEKAEIVILVATSGDTGKAALEGFKDVPQTRIIVFFPHGGVSEMQRLQMVTQEGGNVAVVAVKGNFDDAQNGVKEIFNDRAFNTALAERGFRLSSANSINWGRLAPQIVYYFSAYADMVRLGNVAPGHAVNFVVPTGNFGNILAAYYAKRMGLPINRLLCASNSNNVLTHFLRYGVYDRNRPFHTTLSPSMDILISSNLERLLYHITGGDCAQVKQWMEQLRSNGRYRVRDEDLDRIQEIFWADWADDAVTLTTIKEVYEEHCYLLDPHTAVAWHVLRQYREKTNDATPTVVVSTASPFKFNASVLSALTDGKQADGDEFAMLRQLSENTGWPIPPALATLAQKPVRHHRLCARDDMKAIVQDILS